MDLIYSLLNFYSNLLGKLTGNYYKIQIHFDYQTLNNLYYFFEQIYAVNIQQYQSIFIQNNLNCKLAYQRITVQLLLSVVWNSKSFSPFEVDIL